MSPRRDLIVDDDAVRELERRKLITTVLRAAGASVVTANSAADAFVGENRNSGKRRRVRSGGLASPVPASVRTEGWTGDTR